MHIKEPMLLIRKNNNFLPYKVVGISFLYVVTMQLFALLTDASLLSYYYFHLEMHLHTLCLDDTDV